MNEEQINNIIQDVKRAISDIPTDKTYLIASAMMEQDGSKAEDIMLDLQMILQGR